MAARRAAELGETPLAKLDAFDAARMETMLEEALLTFATERFPREAAERRALHESIRHSARGIFAALHLLEEAAVAARTAGAGQMLTAWRSWLAAVDRVFVAADAAWPEVNLMLLDARESGARSR
jgi:hypothetical protein